LRLALFPELQALEELGGVDVAGVEGGEELDGLFHFELVLEAGGLQADTDAVFELAGLDLGIAPEDGDASAGSWTQSFENFDGGGLAGAVGSEEAEDFAGADFEVDAFDGLEGAVVLFEGFDFDGVPVPTSIMAPL